MTPRDRAFALLGTWSRPPDFPSKVALVLAVVLLLAAGFGAGHRLLFGETRHDSIERRTFLFVVAMGAGLLSIAYLSVYLRGGPRIIDATTYFLQGRALSHGDLAWTPLEPSASFRGRFLLYRDGAGEPSLGGIFPPGYPLLLALGFLLRAPTVIGPVLAVALVLATYQLGREVAARTVPELTEPVARAAALLSLLCAALRYHTADTMSHAASALGITIALTCSLRARQRAVPSTHGGRGWAILAGLAIGCVVATRPTSAIPIALVTAWLLGQRSPRLLAYAVPAGVPGLFLLLLSQHAVTGSWIASTQRVYYAISDGPPGCFRWGFGSGTGCLFEHGTFVHDRLPNGYGFAEALATTLRRLHHHLLDVANLEPLALVVLVPAFARRNAATGSATALVLLQVLVYAPFYFDGDYPAGGARFFADVLPVEHVLVMVGAACLVARRAKSLPLAFPRAAFLVLGLAAAGFALHAAFEHRKLRDRDGGRPMFEPDVLAQASLEKGLVFVDTDHGFALGHDPSMRPENGVVVARFRGDDRDRMLYDQLARPPTYRYKLEPASVAEGADEPSTPTLTLWTPPAPVGAFRFEAEAEWPALSQEGGFAVPEWTRDCASARRALVLTPTDGARAARATIRLPVPSANRWRVEVHTVPGVRISHPQYAPADAHGVEGRLTIGDEHWSWKDPGGSECATLPPRDIDLAPPHARVTIEALAGPIAIDYISLTKVK